MNETVLFAPFAGRVVKLDARPGQAVVNACQSQPLLVLANTKTLQVRAWLPVEQRQRVKVGQKLEVEIAGQRYRGDIWSLGWQAEERQAAFYYPLDVLVRPGALLPAGLPASVFLP